MRMENFEGWDAIDGLLNDRYGEAERLEWHAPWPYRPAGPIPMGQFVSHSIAIYPRTEPVPHWHLIGYAMTAPYEERGYEFTLRIPRAAGETEAPNWALAHLESLASYVSRNDNDFAVGHYIEYPNPIDPDRPGSAIRAGGFVLDPELGQARSSRGEITFLQFVGITTAELHAAQAWNVEGLIGALEPPLPRLLTDLDRTSLAESPDVARMVREGARRDGSGTGYLFFHQLAASTDDGVRVQIGAQHVPQFAHILPGRIPHGNALILTGGSGLPVVFLAGPEFGHNQTDHALEIILPGTASEELAATIAVEPGDYRISSLPGLTVTVLP
jgi:suppressor of fused